MELRCNLYEFTPHPRVGIQRSFQSVTFLCISSISCNFPSTVEHILLPNCLCTNRYDSQELQTHSNRVCYCSKSLQSSIISFAPALLAASTISSIASLLVTHHVSLKHNIPFNGDACTVPRYESVGHNGVYRSQRSLSSPEETAESFSARIIYQNCSAN